MRRLEIQVNQAGQDEELRSNVRYALGLGLPEISVVEQHEKTLVLVGSGPSMPSFLEDIRKEAGTICAIKGAHDFLIENGITPDWFVNLDPRNRLHQIKYANDHTRYFIASRCMPEMFQSLEGRKITVFHSFHWGLEKWPEFQGRQMIQGGTTSGLRAINIGWTQGYRKFTIYGFDSCLAPDRLTKRFTGEAAGKVIDVIVGGRVFYANHAMAQQAIDWRDYLALCTDCTFDVKGDGLLAAISRETERLKAA